MHLFALLFLGLSVAGAAGESINDYSAQVTRISQSTATEPKEKATSIARIYLDHVVRIQRDKSSLRDDDLHELFAVTGAAFFYSQFSSLQDSRMFTRDLGDVLV